ncbi:MAG: DUF4160 domain-containing protein [Chloroflexi bacterium]|nr:DUF4160 domain-containing protein [Chloroflexota bacterium]
MPVLLRDGPYRFYVVSWDRNEPPHVHVQRDNSSAKFWLNPVELASSRNFNQSEIRRIYRIVERNQDTLLEAWNEYFNS